MKDEEFVKLFKTLQNDSQKDVRDVLKDIVIANNDKPVNFNEEEKKVCEENLKIEIKSNGENTS